jgi:flagellar biosynthesis GTPase FlhF
MDLYTFKARSLAEAMALVRDQLGPDASLLHTREIGSPLVRLLGGGMLEVTATPEPCAPSRLPMESDGHQPAKKSNTARHRLPPAEAQNFRQLFRNNLTVAPAGGASLVEKLTVEELAGSALGQASQAKFAA